MSNADAPALSVGVVGICSAEHVERCLAALGRQSGTPAFEIVVAYDPALQDMDVVARAHPDIRFVANVDQRTPLELAARAILETRGHIVLLTEDHCIPDPDWVATLSAALAPEVAAAGGVVALADGASGTDFAFYFVDFFRYAEPALDGPSPTLTVCNVAYRRRDLDALPHPPWKTGGFHETAVNDALRARHGELRLCPAARVTMRRHVALGAAVRERYVFGRLFGATRLGYAPPRMKLAYRVLAPVLPALLLWRMVRKGLASPDLRRGLRRGGGPLVLMVLAWSLGEWLGYLTGRPPDDLTVAPEAAP